MFNKYRNFNARHTYETETKKTMSNLRKVDNFVVSKRGLTNSTIDGANNKFVGGQSEVSRIFDSLSNIMKK